jgi:hypothetical protein
MHRFGYLPKNPPSSRFFPNTTLGVTARVCCLPATYYVQYAYPQSSLCKLVGEFCLMKYELKSDKCYQLNKLAFGVLVETLSCERQAETGRNCSWHDFASSILTSGISALCLYGAIQLCTKQMVGFPANSESSLSPEKMEFHGNFLCEWNFVGILFGRLLARIAKYLLNGSPREVKFHTHCFALTYLVTQSLFTLVLGC